MYIFKPNYKSINFRSRYKAHLERCKLCFLSGYTLHNSVDYFFNINDDAKLPNLDVDFNIKNMVMYEIIEPN